MENKSYYISIGEPWDFVGPDGKNIIKGEILKKISSTCLIFKTNHFLEYENNKSDILILSPRHYDNDFDDLVKKTNTVTINGGILFSTYSDDLTEDELKHAAKFFVIGSISEPRKN
ncbi:hypothetical protein ACT54M_17005 [Leptospira santarosai]|uniref:hypothetical protein n=1 Tax=Leptospira santarosai TaxID=28183 RepID=UPI0040357AE2